jgi:hypothetical protein
MSQTRDFSDIVADEAPSSGPVYKLIPSDSHTPAGRAGDSGAAATPRKNGADQFTEELDPAETPSTSAPPVKTVDRRRIGPKGLAQLIGTFIILGFVMVLYLLALIGLNAHWIDNEGYTKTAVVLSGPLSLASAVTAFLYGEHKGRNS